MKLPVNQQCIMLIGFVALVLSSLFQKPKNLFTRKSVIKAGVKIALTLGLIESCWLGKETVILVTLLIAGGVVLANFGKQDPSGYVMRKFLLFHGLAVFLWAYATLSHCQRSDLFFIISGAILTGLYPCNGWLDRFFLKAPFYFLETWLVIIRPFLVKIFISTLGHALDESLFLSILIGLSLFFVPILFFAKNEIRRLAADLTCWQMGYIWLFAKHVGVDNSNIVTLLAITQGILISVVLQGAEVTAAAVNNGKADRTPEFESMLTVSSLVLLVATPLIFLFKRGVSEISLIFFAQVICSLLLPAIFVDKFFKCTKPQTIPHH